MDEIAVTAVKQRGSDMSFCADDGSLFNTSIHANKFAKSTWADSRDLWIAEINGIQRAITPVVIRAKTISDDLDLKARVGTHTKERKGYKSKENPLELLWMDCITGSLFDNSGLCKTSGVVKMDCSTIRKSQDEAKQILMKSKAIDTKNDKDWKDLPV